MSCSFFYSGSDFLSAQRATVLFDRLETKIKLHYTSYIKISSYRAVIELRLDYEKHSVLLTEIITVLGAILITYMYCVVGLKNC